MADDANLMTLDEYQAEAQTTAIYPRWQAWNYLTLGLCGEAGEVAGKIKKLMRDHGGSMTPQAREALMAELGDVLWYAALLAWELNVKLSSVAQQNLDKLAARKRRGTLKGEGDGR